MLDLGIVKKDFSHLVGNIHPWMLSHFIMWLDIKVAEYKVYGHMVLDDTPNDTPSWLRNHGGQENPRETVSSTIDERDSQNLLVSECVEISTPLVARLLQETAQSTSNKQNKPSKTHCQVVTDPRKHCPLVSEFVEISKPSETRHKVSLNQSTEPRTASTNHNQPSSVSPSSLQRSHQVSKNHKSPKGAVSRQTRYPENMELLKHRATCTCCHKAKLFDSNCENEGNLPKSKDNPQPETTGSMCKNEYPQNECQEQRAKEIEKSIQISGVRSLNSQHTHVESDQRSTLFLGETSKTSPNQALEKNTNLENSFIEIDPSEIKIEVNSDEEYKQDDSYNPSPNKRSLLDSYFQDDLHIGQLQPVSYEQLKTVSKRALSYWENAEDKSSWRSKKWEYFEKLNKTQKSNYDGAKVHSQSLQNLLPFPTPFPLENLNYGPRAMLMIRTGDITRSGKMEFLDTVFSEVVKYTGLYPSPEQKTEIAESICRSFPKMDAKNNPLGSSVNQWLNILKDKFRNERRMLHHGPYLSRQRNSGIPFSQTSTKMNEDQC